ncbi:MAG TPA: YqaJ viral recombinase family protein [Arthrobacter sp.]|nr:YqaJ viral recombinase family protein [Arthrobacter sp.]
MTVSAEAERLGTAVLRGRYADGSPEWHEARASVIGGSEVGSIMGVNSFESRYVLWYRKAGFLGKTEEVANPLFEWGHRLEPVVAEKFADVHPEFDVQVSGSWVHQDRPWHGANPDRLLAYKLNYIDEAGNDCADVMDVEAVLEIKTSMSGYGWENDMCPVKYVLQLRWYMECFGLEYGYLVVLASLGDYREFLVPRDVSKPVVSMQTGAEEWYSAGGQEMLDAAEEFYLSLPGKLTPEGTPPPIDGGNDTYQMIRERHPDIVNSDIEVTQDLAEELKAALEAEKAAIAEAKRMKSVMLDLMGKNRRAIIPSGDPAKPHIVARRQSIKGGKPYLVTT